MGWVWFPEGPDNIVGTLRRAAITKTDDGGDEQLVDISGLASEKMTKIVRSFPHGFTSHAPADAIGHLLSLGGRADRAMLVGGEHYQYRQRNLPAGTAVLYDDKGNVVFAKGQDGIAVEAKQGKISVKPPAGQNVYLGGNGSDGTYLRVALEDGSPAKNVYALKG